MELKTDRLVLRELGKKDLSRLIELAGNLNVSRHLAVVPHPYSEDDGNWFIDKCMANSKKDLREDYELAIEFEGEFVGCIGLTKVDKNNGTATLGYWLGEGYWRKGIMSEAVSRVISFAYKDLDLRRINVEAATENKGSNSLIKKLGFTHEGTRKQYLRAKSTGEIHDLHIYGMLRGE
tara:strand:+ start:872 stop:1405 length:534 start_codon:yes stop_codon:yes gene_type:complete